MLIPALSVQYYFFMLIRTTIETTSRVIQDINALTLRPVPEVSLAPFPATSMSCLHSTPPGLRGP